MAQQKEKKLKEEDLKLFEENKKKREELQRYGDELPSVWNYRVVEHTNETKHKFIARI